MRWRRIIAAVGLLSGLALTAAAAVPAATAWDSPGAHPATADGAYGPAVLTSMRISLVRGNIAGASTPIGFRLEEVPPDCNDYCNWYVASGGHNNPMYFGSSPGNSVVFNEFANGQPSGWFELYDVGSQNCINIGNDQGFLIAYEDSCLQNDTLESFHVNIVSSHWTLENQHYGINLAEAPCQFNAAFCGLLGDGSGTGTFGTPSVG